MNSNLKGNFGEDIALKFLISNGYELIDCNFKTRYGEIDIILKKDDFLVFVEVKLRNVKSFYSGRFSVTSKKINKIITSSEIFIMENEYNLQPRYDVIEIVTDMYNNVIELTHIENAF